MNINVLVTGGLFDSQSGFAALQFCQAAEQAGHNITQVFFYQGGVSQATLLAEPLADEFDAPREWASCKEQFSIDLVVCVSAAERRGIIGQQQMQDLAKPSFNLHPAFSVAGLGALHDASIAADRTVTFK
jgi:tRNA 2-thiouridine synthesizing protein D